jgi:hypothetical protein
MIKRYKYRKVPKENILQSRKPTIASDKEQLMGSVNGANASDIEERFARALNKRKKDYIFRVPLGTRGEPGWKELDFLVIDGGYFPVEIDSMGFIHQGQETADVFKDAFVMDYLKAYNPYPVKRIPGERLATQEIADNTAKELFP